MAYSTQQAVSDGTLDQLDLSIEYLDRSEISVYFNDVLTTAWTWVGVSAATIRFNTTVANGVVVLVRRTTAKDGLRHSFVGGADFSAATLDEDLLQSLHIAQEAAESNVSGDFFTDVNMHGYKLTNVGTAVDPGDALTLGQYTDGMDDAAAAVAVAAVADAVAAMGLSDATVTKKTSATGSAIIPNGSTAQRDVAPAFGYQRANSTTGGMEWWNGSGWVSMGGGATGSGNDKVFFENDTVISANHTIARNSHAVGPLSINSGVTLTIASGKRLVVL